MPAGVTLGREDEPLGRDAVPCGFLSQVVVAGAKAFERPENRSGNVVQEPHPDLEHLGRDLVGGVEGAEDEAVLGEAAVTPGDDLVRDGTFAVVGLIRVRHADDVLVVIGLRTGRQNEVVGDDVVDEGRAHGSRIAEKVDLDRSRAERHDFGAGSTRVALEIDQDVDLVFLDFIGGVLVGEVLEVVACVEGRDDPVPDQGAVVEVLGRIAVDLGSVAVAEFEEFDEKQRGRVIVEVVREIADLQASHALPLRPRHIGGQRRRLIGAPGLHPDPGSQQVIRGIGRRDQDREHRHPVSFPERVGEHEIQVVLPPVELAKVLAQVE